MDQKRVLLVGAFVVYTAMLLTATHWPGLAIKGPVSRTDLFIHAGAFGSWTVLLWLSGLVRCPTRLLVYGFVFAVMDETTQPLFRRVFDWWDLGADFVGVGLGTLVVRGVLWTRRPRAEESH